MVPLVVAGMNCATADDAFNCEKATGFVGTVCAPSGSGRHPAILILGGSGGGDRLAPFASRFAEHGYVAASVAYFGLPGLPSRLELIPVETVGNALDRISQRADVDPQRIAIFGDSKGGELALLAASTYDRIGAVISLVGSPFAWSIIARTRNSGDTSSWTAAGKVVPFVPLDRRMMTGGSGWEAFEAPLRDNRVAVDRTMFHLENVRGPILFLAAADDRVWDSKIQAEIGMAYLKAHDHRFADEMISYPNSGHGFLFSVDPHTMAPNPAARLVGGTAAGNVVAARAAWSAIDAFLTKALARTSDRGALQGLARADSR